MARGRQSRGLAERRSFWRNRDMDRQRRWTSTRVRGAASIRLALYLSIGDMRLNNQQRTLCGENCVARVPFEDNMPAK